MGKNKAKLKRTIHQFIGTTKVYKPFSLLTGGIGSIFCLHNIIRKPSSRLEANKPIDITVDFFEQIIEYYANSGYQIFSLPDAYSCLVERQKPDKHFIVFTFDDGYSSIYHFAYPVFKKYNIPFTVYVATGLPDRTIIQWWHPLEELLLRENSLHFSFDGNQYQYSTASFAEKEAVFDELRILISKTQPDYLLDLLQAIFQPYEVDIVQESARNALSWHQLQELSSDPLVTIGSHTVNHRMLRKLTDDQSFYELKESKSILEQHLAKSVDHFAYPFGHRKAYSSREIDTLQQLGYKSASTTSLKNVTWEDSENLMQIPRHVITGELESLSTIEALQSGIYGTLFSSMK